MAEGHGVRLVQLCESLCERLRTEVGLTEFRIEIPRESTPLVISLRSSEPLRYDPRHEWLRDAPARLTFDVPAGGGDRVARVEIEDARRTAYPPEANALCERIASEYDDAFRSLLVARHL